jgi:hypothetical protein
MAYLVAAGIESIQLHIAFHVHCPTSQVVLYEVLKMRSGELQNHS